MPELPEVQTVVNQIRPFLLQQKIKRLVVTDKGLRMIDPYSPQQLNSMLINKKFAEVHRHGKYLVFSLDDNSKIYGHLRMSGIFQISPRPLEHVHNRLYLELASSQFLNFIDSRRFGTFHFIQTGKNYTGTAKLGVDALSSNLTIEYLQLKFSKLKKHIYSALLDQTIVAGVGNIYANEILFRSKLHPQMPVNLLSQKQIEALIKNTQQILTDAINYKGTTLIDKSYKDVFGDYGEFSMKLMVYGRVVKPCKICGTPIQRIKLNQRSVYFCPKCQR